MEKWVTRERGIKMKKQLIKVLLIIAGTLSIIIGTIGIFLPLIPTTPLYLLGAECYLKSSKKFYNMLINNKIFGKYIRDYKKYKIISKKSKVIILILLWITMSYSIYYMTTIDMPQYAIILSIVSLFGIAVFVTQHILRFDSVVEK